MHTPNTGSRLGSKSYWKSPLIRGFGIFSFLALFLFFSKMHPLYICDFDDWLYSYQPRAGYPDPTDWNPTKILPETITPILSYLAVYLIYPFRGDYIQSLCDAYAVFYAGLIVSYLLMTGKLLKSRLSLDNLTLTLMLGCFLLAHFLPFHRTDEPAMHLFYSFNVTCIFNYSVPALWNFVLCLFFLDYGKVHWAVPSHMAEKALLLFGVYLAIYSSLWHSVMLMSLFGMRLLFALIDGVALNCRSGKKPVSLPFLLDYAKEHIAKLLALLAWFLSMILEVTGYRSQMQGATSFMLGTAALTCWNTVRSLYVPFLIAVIVLNLAAVLLMHRRKDGEALHTHLELFGAMILCGVFIVLVGAKVNPGYLSRPDVQIAWMLWLMLLSVLSLGYLIKHVPMVTLLLPILLLTLVFETVIFKGEGYDEQCFYEQTPAVVKAVGNDMVAQVLEAAEEGEPSVEVHIPVNGSDGWPWDDTFTPGRLALALYHHGLLDRPIAVSVVPDPAKDLEFHIR